MPTSERQITIRLPEELYEALDELAGASGIRRSEVVRRAIRAYLDGGAFQGDRPYERVRHLLGTVKGGPPDLAARHREYLLEIFRGR